MFDLYTASQIGPSISVLFGGDDTYSGPIHTGGVAVELPSTPDPTSLWVIRSDQNVYVRQLASLRTFAPQVLSALPVLAEYGNVDIIDGAIWSYNPASNGFVTARGLITAGVQSALSNILRRGEYAWEYYRVQNPQGLLLLANTYWPVRVESERNNVLFFGAQTIDTTNTAFKAKTNDSVRITCVSHRGRFGDVTLAPATIGDPSNLGRPSYWWPIMQKPAAFTITGTGSDTDPPPLPF